MKLREALDNVTPGELIDMVLGLADIGKVYSRLKKKQDNYMVNLMKEFMYWKLGNYHWYYSQLRDTEINHIEGVNGIYLTTIADEEPVLIRIT